MQAGSTPSPADRLAFANQLAEFRALDSQDRYKKQLNALEVEYKFILLRSLHLFHKEMLRAKLPGRLHSIKEALSETASEKCGRLEPLDGVAFDYNEIYQCGDYKVTKQRRSNRRYNFKYYLDKHLEYCASKGFNLSCETVQQALEFFDVIEAQLPKRISMPFVTFKIFEKIVKSNEERFILGYFWLQVPAGSVKKHAEKWEEMLRQFDA